MKRLIFLALFVPFLASAQEPATEMGVNATTAAVDELLPVLQQIQTNTEVIVAAAPAACIDGNLIALNLEFSGNYFRMHLGGPTISAAWYRKSEAIKIFLTTATKVRILSRSVSSGSVTHDVGTFVTQVEAEACRDALVAVL